jgi:hypothetical protein
MALGVFEAFLSVTKIVEAMAWLQRDQGSNSPLLVNSTANQPAEFFLICTRPGEIILEKEGGEISSADRSFTPERIAGFIVKTFPQEDC